MPLPSWTDEHDELLRRAAPPTPEFTDDDLAAVWARVVTDSDRPVGARRTAGARGVRGALAVVIVAGVVGAGGSPRRTWWAALARAPNRRTPRACGWPARVSGSTWPAPTSVA